MDLPKRFDHKISKLICYNINLCLNIIEQDCEYSMGSDYNNDSMASKNLNLLVRQRRIKVQHLSIRMLTGLYYIIILYYYIGTIPLFGLYKAI